MSSREANPHPEGVSVLKWMMMLRAAAPARAAALARAAVHPSYLRHREHNLSAMVGMRANSAAKRV